MLSAAAIGPGCRLCVALSGGVDSVVLLHALHELRERFGYALSAAHVHHGLSPNADAWLHFCQRLCAALGVSLDAKRVSVTLDHPSGIEASARSARHAALNEVEADWLVFGHHLDDQAETLLFRLLRGAGVRGAAAMVPIEAGAPGRLRPLLTVSRADILAYAQVQRLEWIEDESNLDQAYTRNHLRHAVFPLLERAFPGAAVSLARAAGLFREASDLLDDLAAIDREACGGDTCTLAALQALPEARIRNLLRAQIRAMGAEAPAHARLCEAVRQMMQATGASLHLPLGDVACCVYRGRLWLEHVDGAGVVPVTWNGEASLPWGGGCVRFDSVIGQGLDAGLLDDVVLISRWPGLAMRLGVGRPRRSFKNLCQEAGVPAWLRPRLPVLRVRGEAAWVAEIGVAPEFACPPDAAGVVPVWQR
ncbi:MAG: tRNA lysidine(34) synthetase TilS [Rhodocyclales bacterium]|nr:tRNA lysidine(34) synthetase TilS [Rhodocyclales bacterium]